MNNINIKSLLLILACGLITSGCVPTAGGPADSFGVDFSLPDNANKTGAIVFFVDGLNAETFQQMLESGDLPAIKKYFLDRGLYAPRAVVNTPSVTLANMTSFVTGQFPGHHGVTGINWFDRDKLIWRNYETIAQKNTLDGDYDSPNIYEQFNRTTMSIFFQPHRGTTKFFENRTSAGPPFFFGWYEFVDRLTLYRFDEMMGLAREKGEFPALTIAYMLAPDFRAYGYGVSSQQYRDAIKHTDRQIGRVLGDLEKAHLLDKLTIVLVSDHGLSDIKSHLPLDKYLGFMMDISDGELWEDDSPKKRQKHYDKHSVVTYGSGDRYWAICLRKPIRNDKGEVTGFEPWSVRPAPEDILAYPVQVQKDSAGKIDIPSLLLDIQVKEYFPVDAVAYSVGTDKVRVKLRRGEVEFRQPGGRGKPISYHLISGGDPFEWKGKVSAESLEGKPMGQRQWLKATCNTQYPDLPAQILAYFRAPRAGDVAVFAAPGWDFRDSNKAGHGGLRPGEMHVPLLIAGPGVPKGRLDAVRTVDVMPTILKLLGRPLPAGMDGQPIIP